MKNILIVIAIFLGSLSGHADVLEDLTGKTQMEREIRWVWKYLPDIVSTCVQPQSSCKDAELNRVISKLIAAYPQKPQKLSSPWGNELQFISEKDRPDIFKTGADEEHRIAVTALTSDATIYINADRMNMPLAKWVGILAHESVHHLGYPDDETRLPDRVGAMIETQFEKISSSTSLEEYTHPDFHVTVINTNKEDSPSAVLLSFSVLGYDEFLGPNARVPICASNERFKFQNVGAVNWRTTQVQPATGIVKLKGSSVVHSTCENLATKERVDRPSLFVTELSVKLKAFDPQAAWWTMPSSYEYETLRSGNDDSHSGMMDVYRTMMISSSTHEKTILLPGDIWKSQFIVESTDHFIPKTCSSYLSGIKWSFHDIMDLPAAVQSGSCMIKSLGNSKIQIDIETQIPPYAQPDFFYIAWIAFTDNDSWRYAVPARPSLVELKDPQAYAPMKIVDWRVIGLNPISQILGTPTEKSYHAALDQNFWIEVDVEGTQGLGNEYIELDQIATDYNGEMVLGPMTIEVQTDKKYIKKFERVSISGGVRLRYQMAISSDQNLEVNGIRLVKFYSFTNDFSWVEFDLPKKLSGFIVDDKI